MLRVFFYQEPVKTRSAKLIPAVIATVVITIACAFQLISHLFPQFDLFQRLEGITYDWRMRNAAAHSHQIAPNLGAVFIDEPDLQYFNTNENYGFSFPWPRLMHGHLVSELSKAGARAVAFDILFIEQHEPTAQTDVPIDGGNVLSSDEFFAQQLSEAKNVILASGREEISGKWSALMPAPIFATNATIGSIWSQPDPDGVLRRVFPFRDDPQFGRIWDMGFVLAAKDLNADLSKALVDKDQIVIRGSRGQRVIPLNPDGTMYIDWTLAWGDPHLTHDSYENVMQGMSDRDWRGKLVVVGVTATGNNISDLGATPLSNQTYLVSKQWNVANSILTSQFIRRSSIVIDLLLIIFLGAFAAVVTWEERALASAFWVLGAIALYVVFALGIFVQARYWVPIALPVSVAILATHVCLLIHRAIFENDERQRVKAVFSKMVSPNIVKELLGADKIALGGARREITIFFSDVRGFTEMTDSVQAAAEQYVQERDLSAAAAEKFYDDIARETLRTVNLYLATTADIIKKYDGTLDKYIGDCVMAFWGAPTSNDQHALCCVRAAIDAQRAVYRLNAQRTAENEKRKAAGRPAFEMLPILAVGCGINTGQAIAGIMGSDGGGGMSYTVFGREVNVASRLEGVSGRSRIIISEATYEKVLRDDPKLAATCIELEPVTVKGIGKPVKIFEVPWKTQDMLHGTNVISTSAAESSASAAA